MKIFLSAPFTLQINKQTRMIDTNYRQWLERLITFVEDRNHSVKCSHIREEWGAKRDSPEVAAVNDFSTIKEADMVVAYLGRPISLGVQIELGYVAALKKRLIVLSDADDEIPFMVQGLHSITKVDFIRFKHLNDLLTQLNLYI